MGNWNKSSTEQLRVFAIFNERTVEGIGPFYKQKRECGNHYKCNFIPIWLSLNPNAL